MIHDLSTTTSFPEYDDVGYTLDEAYQDAQDSAWITFFGDLISWALFACLTIQVYFYFINFPQDRRLIKMTVLLLFLVEIAATAFLTWTGFVTHIVHWGHAVVFMPGIWGSMMFDCSIASIVHALYGWRIYKLVVRRWLAIGLTILIALLSLGQFACCVSAALFNALQKIEHPETQWVARRLFHGWLTTATAADIIITTVMAIKLFSARTGVRSTDRAITKLLYVTIPGGALTALITLAILIIQIRFTGAAYYQLPIICLTKFYSNSVLVCLNLRASNVNGSGRHTMLSGFQTDNQIDTSRLHFNIQVDQKVEKCTSSSGFMSSAVQFHSDPVCNSSDYGVNAASRDMVNHVESQVYPIGFQTMPLQLACSQARDVKENKSTLTAIPNINCDGHPYRTNDDVAAAMEAPKYHRSMSSIYSTQASRGHDQDEKHDFPMSVSDKDASDTTCLENEINLDKNDSNHT